MKRILFMVLVLIAGILPLSCASMVINLVSDALTGTGSSAVFTGDPDINLVGDALPFAIKMYEALLAQNPNHQGLILTTGSLFVMYANAYVQGPADMLPRSAYSERETARSRAKQLYLRGTELLFRGLEQRFPGFGEALKAGDIARFLPRVKKEDVPLIYWTVAGTLSAFALNPMDLELGMKIQPLAALINRAYELDPDYDRGTLDDFFILFHSSIPVYLGGDPVRVPEHFRLAVEKSGGLSASPYVSYAEAVCIPAGDYEGFRENLERALAIDVNAGPENRLVNLIAQRKARYLLDNASYFFYFLDSAGEEGEFDWEDDGWGDEALEMDETWR
ncbi:MAG: TRAP transporter TatT component family protein [Treponema sp.]|nr:TRAP transporter TatT component family protein [Treponema sp.]